MDVKTRQKNWIGLKNGYTIKIKLSNSFQNSIVNVFVESLERIHELYSITLSSSHIIFHSNQKNEIFAINPLNDAKVLVKSSSYLQLYETNVTYKYNNSPKLENEIQDLINRNIITPMKKVLN